VLLDSDLVISYVLARASAVARSMFDLCVGGPAYRTGRLVTESTVLMVPSVWPTIEILMFFNLLEATIFDAILKMQFYGI
jgi:hypothetical protein